MFEPDGKKTLLGLGAEEWEAVSHGIDGALEGDLDWQASLNKLKKSQEENPDETAYKTCIAEMHYFRSAFTAARYLQTHWKEIAGGAGGAFAAGFVMIRQFS